MTTQRKRSACGQLRTLALELGVEEGNARLDMTIQQFDSLANDLEMRCTTPQQRGKLRQVVAHFHNRPAVPPLPGSVPAAAPREPEDREAAAAGRQFRLRSQGCLFTYTIASEHRFNNVHKCTYYHNSNKKGPFLLSEAVANY